jgi:1-deoxy-D-xylulose-5-phosphate reductoisomerase
VLPDADTLVNGLVGSIGCRPTMEAIRRGLRVCLANKETLVMAGELIETLLQQHPQASLHPIDSEHSALYQAIAGRPVDEIESLVLTASGGPFRELAPEQFANITVEQALKHPTWTMGPKITIDSSTLFNKGLEVIEAHFLFRVPYERIEVLVHPGSHVHSFVQFRDGALMAQLGTPDMRLPILYSLVAPERVALTGARLDLASLGTLRFEKPDHARFPALGLAYRAGQAGGIHPAVLNAANEAAVALFLERSLTYTGISRLVEAVLDETQSVSAPDFDELLAADAWARRRVQELSRAEVPA